MLRIRSLFVVVALLAASCTSGSAQETPTAAPTTVATSSTTTTTTSTTTTTTIPANPPSPLNGLPAEDPALLERRVIAVKVDNHWDARPQSGLQEADAVFELLVEAGLTRFIALFHDNDSAFVGPMRSGRPTDPTLLSPLGATFAISGAQPWVTSLIAATGVRMIGEVRPATFRTRDRRAPHNLYTDTMALREYADARGYADEPPPDLFRWGDQELPPDAIATRIELGFSNSATVTWEWNGERYLRFLGEQPHEWRSQDGETTGQIGADTLVVLFAPRYTARPPSGQGSSVPAMDTVGAGRALLFAGGRVVEGTWDRTSIDDVFELTTDGGEPLTVPPGVPWVSIFPEGRSVSW